MAISAGVELDIEVGFTGLKYARFAASAGQRFSAALDANYTGSWSYGPVELGSRTFAPITFSIGPVPVVAQPSLSASLSASGTVGGLAPRLADPSRVGDGQPHLRR